MKKVFLKITFLSIALAILFTSCKKTKDAVIPDDTADQKAQASDDATVQAESDQAVDDANNVFMGSSKAGARIDGPSGVSLCGATIDSSSIGTGKIILNFDGSTVCAGGRKRFGRIILQLVSSNGKWNTAGATITISFSGYKVFRNGKFISINGTHIITNVRGGLEKNLTGSDTLVHKIRGGVNLTFEDSTKRAWVITKRRSITGTPGNLKIITSGDSSIGTITNVSVSGINRKGNAFHTVISKPVVLMNCSGVWNIIDGVKVHTGIERELTVTFGLNSSGAFDGTCSSNTYKLTWTDLKGAARTELVTY